MLLLSSCTTTYYYVVRHAERKDNSSDSPLSAEGFERANVLKDSLANKGINLILASNYIRTQQTVKPLADDLKKPVVIYDANHTDSLLNALKQMKGKHVVVVGHSDTVPEIVTSLSGETVASITHTDFDNLYIIKVTKGIFGSRHLWRTTYGRTTE